MPRIALSVSIELVSSSARVLWDIELFVTSGQRERDRERGKRRLGFLFHPLPQSKVSMD